MSFEICKWRGGANAPFLLWVDDLANAWVDLSGNGIIEKGEDWGHAMRGRNSALEFLEDNVLAGYEDIKATFFTPVGARSPIVRKSGISFFSNRIDSDEERARFFKTLDCNPRYEIAYHGTTHGVAGDKTEDFVQEWETYSSIENAMETIKNGIGIYENVMGRRPAGGKYCGYRGGRFGDDSIDCSGFLWWCRYSNVGLMEYKDCDYGGSDRNPVTNYDVKFFGGNNVIDIPTSVDGGVLTRFLHPDRRSLRGVARGVLKNALVRKKLAKLDFLIENKLVVSVQEHISPSRNDGRVQVPNIYDDIDSLRTIFEHVRGKNVWYCTGTELAEYVHCRENCSLIGGNKGFEIEFEIDSRIESPVLSLDIEGVRGVAMPDGRIAKGTNGVFDIDVMEGIYEFIY